MRSNLKPLGSNSSNGGVGTENYYEPVLITLSHNTVEQPPGTVLSFQNIRSQFTKVLHLQESPHRTALAFAIGIFIAFSPTYGLHTVTVALCTWVFRLNFLAIFLGALVNNPWTIAPILGLTLWTGFMLLGMPNSTSFQWETLTLDNLYEVISPYLLPFITGGCVLGLAGSLLAYPVALLIISKTRRPKSA